MWVQGLGCPLGQVSVQPRPEPRRAGHSGNSLSCYRRESRETGGKPAPGIRFFSMQEKNGAGRRGVRGRPDTARGTGMTPWAGVSGGGSLLLPLIVNEEKRDQGFLSCLLPPSFLPSFLSSLPLFFPLSVLSFLPSSLSTQGLLSLSLSFHCSLLRLLFYTHFQN